MATGDFNGDGIPDLVSVAQGNDTVSVLLGKADGTFNPAVSYPTGPAPTAVVVADFNGDGNLDIAVSNGNCVIEGLDNVECLAGTVSILLGNGDGSFQSHLDYATGRQPSSVAVGDFNGDGKPDLAITNVWDNTVSVLLGNGDGTFQPQIVYTTPLQSPSDTTASSQALVIGDFNGDHKLDLAVACAQGVSVLLGRGDGTFNNHIDSSNGGGNVVVAGDFNTVTGTFTSNSTKLTHNMDLTLVVQ